MHRWVGIGYRAEGEGVYGDVPAAAPDYHHRRHRRRFIPTDEAWGPAGGVDAFGVICGFLRLYRDAGRNRLQLWQGSRYPRVMASVMPAGRSSRLAETWNDRPRSNGPKEPAAHDLDEIKELINKFGVGAGV